MDYHDWSDLGNDIRRMVDDAVNSGDFRRLDENVRRTVTDGLENLGDSLRKGMEALPERKRGRVWGAAGMWVLPRSRREKTGGPDPKRGVLTGADTLPASVLPQLPESESPVCEDIRNKGRWSGPSRRRLYRCGGLPHCDSGLYNYASCGSGWNDSDSPVRRPDHYFDCCLSSGLGRKGFSGKDEAV